METSRVDAARTIAVLVMAIGQVGSAALVPMLGTSDTGTISDANVSPVTPAGYAFIIWGLIYLACLALAGYQLLPGQRGRDVHRRTGWWLTGAFACAGVWVPIFNTGLIWVAQVVIMVLLTCLLVASLRLTRLGPAQDVPERLLLRLPVTVYLGWVTVASAAGFGATLRALGMPAGAVWLVALSLILLGGALAISLFVVSRCTAAVGFAASSIWALLAVAVGSYVGAVRIAAVLSAVVVLGVLTVRTVRSRRATVILVG